MYDNVLKDQNVSILRHYGDNYVSCGHLYVVRLNGKDVEYRNNFITKMAEKGIATNVHYKPLPMHTAYKNLGFDIKDYPNAFDMYKNEVTLPLNSLLTADEANYVIENFIECLKD